MYSNATERSIDRNRTLDNISAYLRNFVRHPHLILADREADAADLSDCIHLVQSAAFAVLQTLPGPFDLICNDILSYLASPNEAQQILNACLQHLLPGGLLLGDNAFKFFPETLLQHPHADGDHWLMLSSSGHITAVCPLPQPGSTAQVLSCPASRLQSVRSAYCKAAITCESKSSWITSPWRVALPTR